MKPLIPLYLLAMIFASCSPSYNVPPVKPTPGSVLEEGCTSESYGHTKGCVVDIPEEAIGGSSSSRGDQSTIEVIVAPADVPGLREKTQVNIYFEINCFHCTEYKRMLTEERVQERFPQFQFNLVCVELPGFGQPGRCRQEYGNDGRAEYDQLTQRLGRLVGTPTTLVDGQELRNAGDLVRVLEEFHK